MFIEENKLNIIIKRSFFDNRKRYLILSKDFIEFEDKDLIGDSITRYEKNQIAEYRFGIKWIRGFEFIIGREYQIFIKNKHERELKISFARLYGFEKKAQLKHYLQILETLWDYYFKGITNDLLVRYLDGESIKIGDVLISKQGIQIKSSGIFSEVEKQIP